MAAHFCPACGTPLDEGARFCMNCGKEIVPPSELEAQAAWSGIENIPEPLSEAGAQETMAPAATQMMDPVAKASRLAHIPPIEPVSINRDETAVIAPNPSYAVATGMVDADKTQILAAAAPPNPSVFSQADPGEPDLSGFDIPAAPRPDTFGQDEWASERPAGWTSGMTPQATTNMPQSAPAAAPVTRSGTEVMEPIGVDAYGYAQPATNARTFSSENTARKSYAGRIALIVILVLLIFGLVYVIQFNPYLFENLGYSIRQAFGEAAANGFDAAVQGVQDLIANLANMAR